MFSLTKKQYSGKAEGDARPKGDLMTILGPEEKAATSAEVPEKSTGSVDEEGLRLGQVVPSERRECNGRGHQHGVLGEPPKGTQYSETAEGVA